MNKILASTFIGLCIFLGNISSQAKSYKIVEHISHEDSSTNKAHAHHHHSHHPHHKSEKKTSESKHHHHHAELSSLTISLAFPAYEGFISEAPMSFSMIIDFYSINFLNQLSFSPPVFRPPIA